MIYVPPDDHGAPSGGEKPLAQLSLGDSYVDWTR